MYSSNQLLSSYSTLINDQTHKVNNNRTVSEFHHFVDNFRFIFHTENVQYDVEFEYEAAEKSEVQYIF
jgi:hypothetical protein